MVAEYTVKRNGKWFKAGEEIPDIFPGEKSSGGYTKTEINRMSTADLKELAREHEVSNVDDMTGQDLKEYFITRFNL